MTDFRIVTFVFIACNSQSRCLLYSNPKEKSSPNCKKKCPDSQKAFFQQLHFLEYTENRKMNRSPDSVKKLLRPFGSFIGRVHVTLRKHRKTQKKKGLAIISLKSEACAAVFPCNLPRVLLDFVFFKQGLINSDNLHGRRFFSRYPTYLNYYKFSLRLSAIRKPGFFTAPLQMFLYSLLFYTPVGEPVMCVRYVQHGHIWSVTQASPLAAHGFSYCQPDRVPFAFLSNFTGRVSPGIFFCLILRFCFLLRTLRSSSLARRQRITTLPIVIVGMVKGEVGNMKGRVPVGGFSLMSLGPGMFINVRKGTGFLLSLFPPYLKETYELCTDISLYLCGHFPFHASSNKSNHKDTLCVFVSWWQKQKGVNHVFNDTPETLSRADTNIDA